MREITRDDTQITVQLAGGSGMARRVCHRSFYWADLAEEFEVPVETLKAMSLRSHCYTSHTGNKRTLGTALKYSRSYYLNDTTVQEVC